MSWSYRKKIRSVFHNTLEQYFEIAQPDREISEQSNPTPRKYHSAVYNLSLAIVAINISRNQAPPG